MDTNTSGIETESLAAVKNLRSKFEQLANSTPGGAVTPRKTSTPISIPSFGASGSVNALTPDPAVPQAAVVGIPRQRATSGSISISPSPIRPEAKHLRSSSSSSDLKGTKRPPPPPPSRGGVKPYPSPTGSPLLRPVPAPPSRPNSLILDGYGEDDESLPISVSSLRDKFSIGKVAHSPRSSLTSLPSQIGTGSTPSISSLSTRPIIPPRPATAVPTEEMHTSRSSCSSSSDPFSYDGSEELDTDHSRQPSIASSRTSSEGETIPPIKVSVPPPRPPPRRPTAVSSDPSGSQATTPTTSLAPPLPLRRATVDETIHAQPGGGKGAPPPLPTRPSIPILSAAAAVGVDQEPTPTFTPTVERKPLGSSKLPPPPTRTILPKDKLPPARAHTPRDQPGTPSSDEDSASDDEPLLKGQFTADLLPDTSRSSRRPPHLAFKDGYTTNRIHIPAHTGHAVCCGTRVVVGAGHHVRVYDLMVSEVPVYDLDTRGMCFAAGSKDVRVSALEFRQDPSGATGGAGAGVGGCLLWVGTKEGHLIELDVKSGIVTAVKLAAHLHPILYLFRYGGAMVSVDESGKVLIFGTPTPEHSATTTAGSPAPTPMSLTKTTPRVIRITEKLDFAKMIRGMLWTAARSDCQGAGTPARTPIIRVYDPFNAGGAGKSIIPTDHVGPVTSAAIIPSDPSRAYVGHEEGFITIWELDTEDGYPRCIEVVKVSVSDVLSLEGVNDKLWAGGRNGMISAYDVGTRPWVVTNCWNAHPGLPVSRLVVDWYGVFGVGKLCVLSVGRDEQCKLWDGLLALDWVDKELLVRENEFSKFRDLKVLIMSWNCDSAKPESLTGDPANVSLLHDVLHSVDSPDIISFGLQEVIDLESRKMTAKNVLLGKKKGEEGNLAGLSDNVTRAYKRWYEAFLHAVRMAMPVDSSYSVIHTESLVGLFTCIFVKNSERSTVKDLAITTVKRGMGGRYGNKGAIMSRFVIDDSSICLINCHLAAGQNAVRTRNADVAGMLEEKALFSVGDQWLSYVGGGDGSMVLDHEIVFANGDMNYRIDQRREPIIAAIRANDYVSLCIHDQLLKEIKHNRGFRFRGFSEGPLSFPPTYKYDRRSDTFDSSEKRRAPAWCDRILWRSRTPARVQQLHYRRYEANVSDHRPISAAFKVTVKSVQHEVRERVKAEVEAQWSEKQQLLMDAMKAYLADHLLV